MKITAKHLSLSSEIYTATKDGIKPVNIKGIKTNGEDFIVSTSYSEHNNVRRDAIKIESKYGGDIYFNREDAIEEMMRLRLEYINKCYDDMMKAQNKYNEAVLDYCNIKKEEIN